MVLDKKTINAIHDLRYLLNRGYPRDSAVEFVSDHYLLELEKRHLLTRCVFPRKEIKKHRKSSADKSDVRGKEIGVDGYNVLITVETILNGDKVINCDDGFIRDLQAIFGKYKMNETTKPALLEILQLLKTMEPEKVLIFFDKQVSKSGELAGLARKKLKKLKINGNARTATGVDKKVWECEISASSDIVVIEKSRKVLDIPKEVIKEKKSGLIDLTNT
ncbi:hypothetical protein AKJ50_00745 [candidate division MSBL1 archaeon SCGC-AAA382A13]|uniref:DUF434 domain-containing protein n=2 Tax=candidate division MSBL1 TaxID=215777 RepID=A0A133VG90_9EURY|nr:hypothetical protein AKJ49_00775 [candidate division MSBL1 archaeon SCGC-AAA382A03]KXB05531.1 hypothetical protein AKJ50_00745 [candidate division MSBL1 archaeon SCGC-AAA382A13]